MVIDFPAMGRYALQRLTERTTWIGLIGLVSAAGVAVSPALAEQIAAAGMGLAGVILIVTQDKPKLVVTTNEVYIEGAAHVA